MIPDVRTLIDLERYPIDQPGTGRDAVLERVHAGLERDGCAVLKGFATPTGIAALVSEANSVSDRGHRYYTRTNPYFTSDDPALPPDDPLPGREPDIGHRKQTHCCDIEQGSEYQLIGILACKGENR